MDEPSTTPLTIKPGWVACPPELCGGEPSCAECTGVPQNNPLLLTCFYCFELADTSDHLIPQSLGSGKVSPTVPACRSCNSSKGARTPSRWAIDCELAGKPLPAEIQDRIVMAEQIMRSCGWWEADEDGGRM